ncbi:unnamed protein product [Effrenium voratum]|nr:unnamed protein product [Effrenium voratum]
MKAFGLPDECWRRVLGNLEATELSGSVAPACRQIQRISEHPDLWQTLLRSDFCSSLNHRAMFQAWMHMHHSFHPRQLYIFKRREHSLDLEMARTELQHRGEQAREQERKQRRLRALNYFLVRVAHCLLCMCLLATSILLWLQMKDAIQLSYYVIFAPMFGFEVFVVISAIITFAIYFQRSSAGWTFYWNRLQGTVRWFILSTSPCECLWVLGFAFSALPLLAAILENDIHLPWPKLRFLPPFLAFWMSTLCLALSVLRRRSCSSSCIGSCLFLWLPLAAFSSLCFLRLSVWPTLSPTVLLLPLLLVTCMLILFSSFLTVASFWLGWRGSRDWMEYATTTLVAILAVLLPLLSVELALVGYLKGDLAINWIFVPWTVWLTGLLMAALWQSLFPLKPQSVMDRIPRYRTDPRIDGSCISNDISRRGQDLHVETELLLMGQASERRKSLRAATQRLNTSRERVEKGDDNVPPTQPRHLARLVQSADGLEDLQLVELPGVGHWFSQAEPSLASWLERRLAAELPEPPRSFEFTVTTPGHYGTKGSWRILQQLDASQPARIVVEANQSWRISSFNVRRLALEPGAPLGAAGAAVLQEVRLDGSVFDTKALLSGACTHLCRSHRHARWKICGKSSSDCAWRSLQRFASANDVLRAPVCLVAEPSWRRQAVALANKLYFVSRYAPPIVEAADAAGCESSNLVLLGGNVKSLSCSFPYIGFTEDSFVLDGNHYLANSTGLLAVGHLRERRLLLLAGEPTALAAVPVTSGRHGADFMLMGSEPWKGEANILAAGCLTPLWGISPSGWSEPDPHSGGFLGGVQTELAQPKCEEVELSDRELSGDAFRPSLGIFLLAIAFAMA